MTTDETTNDLTTVLDALTALHARAERLLAGADDRDRWPVLNALTGATDALRHYAARQPDEDALRTATTTALDSHLARYRGPRGEE